MVWIMTVLTILSWSIGTLKTSEAGLSWSNWPIIWETRIIGQAIIVASSVCSNFSAFHPFLVSLLDRTWCDDKWNVEKKGRKLKRKSSASLYIPPLCRSRLFSLSRVDWVLMVNACRIPYTRCHKSTSMYSFSMWKKK